MAANYIVSQLAVWEINFPGGVSNDNAVLLFGPSLKACLSSQLWLTTFLPDSTLLSSVFRSSS